MFHEKVSEKLKYIAHEIGTVRVQLEQKGENDLANKLFEALKILAEINKLDNEVKANIERVLSRI